MTALRSLLVHLDASPGCAQRIAIALELAAQHDARVTALYAVTPTVLSLPFVMGQGAAPMFGQLQELDVGNRDAAKALFDGAIAARTQPARWREFDDGPVILGVAEHALCNDLMVLGQYDRGQDATAGVPPDFVASVLIASGRPALVVPYVEVGVTPGRDVLVAWKPTRESAHALSAAIPLLRAARQIHLTLEGSRLQDAGEIEDYLRLHGVAAPIRRHTSVLAEAPGEGLLSLAADVGADLLVMGCYGHSRARELVLGGASRTVLQSMTLPVLMAH